MVFVYIDYLAARERHRDLLRQAERDRLLRLSRQARIAGRSGQKRQRDPVTITGLARRFKQLAVQAQNRIKAPVQRQALLGCCSAGAGIACC